MTDQRRPLFGSLILIFTAVIWGLAFVAQSAGMDDVGPYTFQCCRSFLGMAVLLPLVLLRKRRNGIRVTRGEEKNAFEPRQMLLGALCCGLAFTSASVLQQVAMQYADAGKAGFLTALYLIIVPIFGIFLGQRISKKIWFCVILCIGGIYMLSVSGGSGMNIGDVLLILCAVMFAVQIHSINYFVRRVDGVWLSFAEIGMACLLTVLPMIFIDHPTLDQLRRAAVPILYAGVMSSGVAYTLQIVGQKHTPPTTASLIMSMEAVFALLGGIVILRQIPTPRETLGCVLVFVAVILSQIGGSEEKAEKQELAADTNLSAE